MRAWLAVALLAALPVGCGGDGGSGTAGTVTDQPSLAANERIERCTERFLDGVDGADSGEDEARRYIEVTYCVPLAERGWVYEDGTLSIAAHTWLIEGSPEECVWALGDGPAKTVPCEQLELPGELQLLDCAILHRVRRSEVRDYVEQLRRSGEVECDDGTPLEELGAPG